MGSYEKCRLIVWALVLIVLILRISFTLMRTRLKTYRLPFELIYILSVVISVVKMWQYISLYLAGDLLFRDFEMSFMLEVGTYGLSLLSLTTYLIRRKETELTKDMYDKCEVCNGDLYAHGPPDVVATHHICGSCIRTINENKAR